MSESGPARGSWYTPLVAALLFIGAIGAAHDDSGAQMLPVLVLAAVATLCLPAAWWHPLPAVGVAGAAIGAYFALGLPNGPLFAVVPMAAFIAAQRLRWPRLWPAVLPALVMVTAGLALRAALHEAPGHVTAWQTLGVVALTLGGSLAGLRLNERKDLRAEQARRSATEEQLRMAQGLHDGVGHGLAVIAMHAQVAMHVLEKTTLPAEDAHRLRQSLDAIRSSSQDSLAALRRELTVMSSGSASRAPAPGLADLRPLLDRVRSGGLAVELPSDVPLESDVPPEVGQVVFAVVQESLTNVLRHAQAQRAVVTFRLSGGRLSVTIADDGVGSAAASSAALASVPASVFAPVSVSAPAAPLTSGSTPASFAAPASMGMGIAGMRKYVENVGGHLETPAVASGFVVNATIPVPS